MTKLHIALPGVLLLLGTQTSWGQSPEIEEIESAVESTIVYSADFFAPYNPASVNDMLDRIPGLSLDGGGGGDRGLGTSGNLLINGQRIAGKDNSPRDQLDRIAAREVEQIEIIRDTSGNLGVRGASQVVNIILDDAQSRSSTSAELVTRHNHDDTFEAGASVSHNRQIGNFQALVNLEARPNYENRDNREVRFGPSGDVLGTLFETNIRDQDEYEISSNMSYSSGAHRMQLNTLYGDADHPRPIRRDFVDFADGERIDRAEEEQIDNTEFNWEIGGDYEYTFADDSRFLLLFVANDETRDSLRERYVSNSANTGTGLEKDLFIESNERTRERIVQGNYSFALNDDQSLRLGMERADTLLDSSLFIGSSSGSDPASERFGGLSPLPELSNPGTEVQEIRYEGFVFHNWLLNDRMSLESSLVYESSKITQAGVVEKNRNFNFFRPSLDYRFNITESFQLRASAARNISQLSFANFAVTANEDDRDRDATAANPELVQEKRWRYEVELEYRLPNDNGVFNLRLFYDDIDDYIGKINATVEPDNPQSAVGNIGTAKRWGTFAGASTRLSYLNLPDAIVSLNLNLFDSEIIDPFLGTKQRINDRGDANLEFRHDITDLGLNYGIDYRLPFDGGVYDIDITTITHNLSQPSLNLFISKVLFDDVTFRLESNNTLDDSRCRERRRFDGTTVNGTLRLIENSCSSRYRRLTLSIQTIF
ncbi:MAG: TonB-dependent receptor [Pseudohongiellaceae bacterium]